MHGYWAEARGRRRTEMAPPAVNLFITSAACAVTRPGFEDTGWDANNAGHAAEPLWVSEYNVTFLGFDNKVIYIDHEKSDVAYDTGLTPTSETSLSYFNGAVYVTNTTEGVFRIGLTRLDTAAASSATEALVEDGTTYRFETPSGTVRIKGTNEAYTGRDDTSWKFTGMSLSQNYAAGDLVIQTKQPSSLPLFKKIIVWEEALHGFGPQTASTSKTAKRTLFYGDFASASTWAQHEDFSGGKAGTQVVGKKGVLENGIVVKDYLHLFTSDETYSIAVSDLNRSTGARIPTLFSSKYTCQNTRTAAEIDGRLTFVDLVKKRIIRDKINQGGLLEPDELFDAPMRNLLKNMDAAQPFALTYTWEEANYTLYQLHISGQITTLIWDNNPIVTADGTSQGRWLPPVLNWQVRNYFTKEGQLHGTDIMDDTVYLFASSESDDGADIESVWAGGVIEVSKGRAMADFGDFEVSGGLTRATTISFEPQVSETDGKPKPFSSTGLDFGSSSAVAEVPVGSAFTPGSSTGADFANFDKSWKVSPAKGRSFQPIIRCEGDGQAMRIDSWRLPKIKFYGSSVLTSS
jgi:hypothetical protein